MESSMLTKVISIIYWILCFLVPIGYLLIYNKKVKRKKKKNYDRAFGIAFVMFIILFGIKLLLRLNVAIFEYPNCVINNICLGEGDDEPVMKEEKTTTKKSTSTKSSSQTTNSTTTTKSVKLDKTYSKVKEIEGEKVSKGKTSKGYDIYEIDGITYVDGYMIANKTYTLPEDYAPSDTYTKADPVATKQCATCINNTAYQAYKDMKADASALNLNIYISSGFRSYVTQRNIYNRNVKNNGQAKADTYSARPGSSEHQTGLCFDLNTIDSSFANTAEGKWVNQNAWKYGYIIRYPKGKTDETGYIYESWHLRYVGTELAEKLYNNGDWLTIEDYFGITSKYAD